MSGRNAIVRILSVSLCLIGISMVVSSGFNEVGLMDAVAVLYVILGVILGVYCVDDNR